MKGKLSALFAIVLVSGCGGGGGAGGFNPNGPFFLEDVVASADFPSSLRFAPDGRLFYTELDTGQIRIVQNGQLLAQPFATVPVANTAEQGLLAIAFDPQFSQNGYVYVFYTDPSPLRNRVVRFTDSAGTGTGLTPIVDDLPATPRHNGGRIGFGADGKLYVTIGDNEDPGNSQDPGVVSGKILRYNPDGTVPADNPIPGNPMYAMGLRNSFGLAFHPTSGRPYVSENGANCDDEVNRINAGDNYGWRPGQPCGDMAPGFRQPIIRFSSVIAPTGIWFYTGTRYGSSRQGSLFLASYSDASLRRFSINDAAGSVVSGETILSGVDGAILDVTQGPDGHLYLATDQRIARLAMR